MAGMAISSPQKQS